ncbi:transcription factor FAMA isoform X2 [Morus notabilis]|uniref:transcription factor FAMA isoform X2 n=1 Tax=Morus notabilis TaxID=981085 RepID=UPI000CED72DC|nr:transcription factor FAMA isoform X2 [Morus notabilis]
MEKDDNYSAPMPQNFVALDYTVDRYPHHQQQQFMKSHIHETKTDHHNINNEGLMVNYLLNNPHHHHQQQQQPQLSFADVMQFADFGPKLALNQTKIPEEEEEDDDQSGMDPVYFLKFPVLNDRNIVEDHDHHQSLDVVPPPEDHVVCQSMTVVKDKAIAREDQDHDSVQLQFLGENLDHQKNPTTSDQPNKNKRKRPRTIKSSEEVESQRMTHIAVERNRRKQMNEHLRVLRSLMPGSYVQRGDQASIIGGAIEFVRELEQLLQCLESQKRRRLLGEAAPRQVGPDSGMDVAQTAQAHPPLFPPLPLPNDQMKFIDFETGGLREETAENKSCLADVEVKLLGFDAMIKILSRRRPGQLIKTIAALEDLQFNILHTNITTIEQTVLYSFNVKVTSDSTFSAEEIAGSVQQIFSFIHANSNM